MLETYLARTDFLKSESTPALRSEMFSDPTTTSAVTLECAGPAAKLKTGVCGGAGLSEIGYHVQFVVISSC